MWEKNYDINLIKCYKFSQIYTIITSKEWKILIFLWNEKIRVGKNKIFLQKLSSLNAFTSRQSVLERFVSVGNAPKGC